MRARCIHTDRRGVIGIMVAVMMPCLLAAAALIADGGLWFVEHGRLQIAADAAANGAGYLLLVSSVKSESASAQAAAMQPIALAEANNATAGGLIGTLVTPIAVSVGANASSVTVTLTSQTDTYFARAIGLSGPTMTATATVGLPAGPAPCLLALSPTAADAIKVDNMGSLRASGCGIFSDSDASNAIYLNSGTINGTSVAAVGDFSKSSSGSNTISPASPTDGASPVSDPFAALTAPSAGSTAVCPGGTNFTAYKSTPYTFSPCVFTGNTTIGGNASTDVFAPGIYYVQGSLTFNNASITQAAGVTFVLTGANATFSWTNYSNTLTSMSAPTTGATAGILVWQPCPSGNGTLADSMAGGSTLQISGAIYTPCGAWTINNNAQLTTASGGSMSFIADTIYASGSGGIAAASSTTGSTGGGTRPHLTQ